MQRMDLSKKKSFGGQGIAEPEKFAVKLMATVHKYTNERTGNIDLHMPKACFGTHCQNTLGQNREVDRLR